MSTPVTQTQDNADYPENPGSYAVQEYTIITAANPGPSS